MYSFTKICVTRTKKKKTSCISQLHLALILHLPVLLLEILPINHNSNLFEES